MDKVLYTNEPQFTFTFTPPQFTDGVVIGMYLLGSLKNDRQSFVVSLTGNGTVVPSSARTVSANGQSTTGSDEIFSLAGFEALDPFTQYSIVIENGAPGEPNGYLVVQGVLVTIFALDENGREGVVQQDETVFYTAPQGVLLTARSSPFPPYGVDDQSSEPTSLSDLSTSTTSTTSPEPTPTQSTSTQSSPAVRSSSTRSSRELTTATGSTPTGMIPPIVNSTSRLHATLWTAVWCVAATLWIL
ncbi:hypothetical protein OIV83_001208 [Microbotryomycetes sp. JL201]|nr:hypothetical protein OIV83_001208 [Microbotryomycetes sp. JL201]